MSLFTDSLSPSWVRAARDAERAKRLEAFKPVPLTSVAILTGPRYLGFRAPLYWSQSYIESKATFIVGALNEILNKTAADDLMRVVGEVRDFLDMPQIKRGFKEAPEDCGLSLLETRLKIIVRAQTKTAPAIEYRKLQVG
ncbi:MAG TPA: hypothetical protein VIN59_01825 [Alphaproteobacteria bacterium]